MELESVRSSSPIIKALRIKDVNINDITVANIKQNRIVPILYKQKKSLIFQTPYLSIADPVVKTRHEGVNQFITLFGGDTPRRIMNFYNFIENIETRLTNYALKEASKWFTQKDIILTSLIKEQDKSTSKNPSNLENLYIKWPFDIENTAFVDEYKKPFDYTNLKKGDQIKLIVELSNLWIDKNQFGLVTSVQKVLVKSVQEKIQSEYIFDEEETDSGDNEQTDRIISLFATETKPIDPKSKLSEKKPILNPLSSGEGKDHKPVVPPQPKTSVPLQTKPVPSQTKFASQPNAPVFVETPSKKHISANPKPTRADIAHALKEKIDRGINKQNQYENAVVELVSNKKSSKPKPAEIYIPPKCVLSDSEDFIQQNNSSATSDSYDLITD
jgi:hypothetical protein